MTTTGLLRAATVRVPCSTSNLGAGFDCLGLAFQRYLAACFVPADSDALVTEYTGTIASHSGRHDVRAARVPDLLASTFLDRLREAGAPPLGGRITAHSDIPIGRGLGSSAVATVAGLLLADGALGRASDPAANLMVATAREGHPDNSAPALFGGFVAVARAADGTPVAFRLPLSERIAFVFASPAVDIATAAARKALPARVPHALAARGLGHLAALLHGFATADPELIRLGLLDELHVPHRLPLIPRAAEAFAAAEKAGAWGATISGSGSGLIALCPHDSTVAVREAMTQALAADDVAVTAFVADPDLDGARPLTLETAC